MVAKHQTWKGVSDSCKTSATSHLHRVVHESLACPVELLVNHSRGKERDDGRIGLGTVVEKQADPGVRLVGRSVVRSVTRHSHGHDGECRSRF